MTASLKRMTLEEKVGQLFVTYAYGSTADTADARNTDNYGVATPAEVVNKYKLGGVIYFAWSNNTQNPAQIAGLSNGLQQAARNSSVKTDVPLLISTDQEMGVVYRMGPPATQFPGNMGLGPAAAPATPGPRPGSPGRNSRPSESPRTMHRSPT